MNEIGAKPVEYIVLAWITSVGSALLLGAFAIFIGVGFAHEIDLNLWQQALTGLLVTPLVALTLLLLAQTACFVILHSRSQRVLDGTVIGTGSRNSNIVVALPFETTAPSRFWVAMHNSGWRVLLSIYAAVLAVNVSAAIQSVLPALPLIAASIALGLWHASAVPKKQAKDAAEHAAREAENARINKEQDARQRRLERQLARASTASITEEWIERELKKAFTATAIRAVKNGDASALDKAARRAFVAMNERVPLDDLRERAIAWAGRQP